MPSPADTTTILLADDHRMVRQGFRALLECEPEFSVVGEAADGVEAVELAAKLHPKVLVTDIVMPRLGGLDVALLTSRRSPETRVVILSMVASEASVSQALQNGAVGYVLKDAGSAELVRAVRAAAAGQRYLSPPLAQFAETASKKPRDADGDVYETLTGREREILSLTGEGLTASQIGERLSISARTAEVHRFHAMHKLGLRGKTDVVRFVMARAAGLSMSLPHQAT